ncbi:hypothetical protein GE09DRAFT_1225616 [Coniochaeta sp. 2T2.1]|nr:hypothetical protein GE09DRAFT_1225616 [Coniochaeta sp. 2T2.1]
MASVHSFGSNLAELGSVSSTTRIAAPRYPGLDDGDLERLRILLLFTRRVLSQQSKQQHVLSTAGLPAQRSLHEDVAQFLAGFDGDGATMNSKYTAQVEELVYAVSHQLPSCCFRMSSEDNPLLRGVGAQFEQRAPGEPNA